jgi:hypothetical protein
MTASELKSIRTSMKLNIAAMSQILGWPYRTYQDRELGNRGIPSDAARQVIDAQRRDTETMTRINRMIAADIDRRFPSGILSEPEQGATP